MRPEWLLGFVAGSRAARGALSLERRERGRSSHKSLRMRGRCFATFTGGAHLFLQAEEMQRSGT